MRIQRREDGETAKMNSPLLRLRTEHKPVHTAVRSRAPTWRALVPLLGDQGF